MSNHDVVVIGGGPAGSTAAGALRAAGMNVILLDKAGFPRNKVCAGWITPPVVAATQLNLEDYRKDCTMQPLQSFEIGLGKHSPVRVDYDQIVGYGIRRCEFDDYLLRKAAVPMMLGTPVNSIRRAGDQWVINDDLRAPLLIGAAGHFCPVARMLGAAVGRDEAPITAQEYEFEAEHSRPERDSTKPTGLYFCEDLKGYGWCFRKGSYVNIGYGRDDSGNLAAGTRDFWNWLVKIGQAPVGLKPKFQGHAYLSRSRSTRPLFADGVVLIGDSAGLADSVSGEGIRPAIESALLASRVILSCEGRYTSNLLQDYEALIERRFGPAGTKRHRALPGPLRAAAVRMLMKSSWFARHVVLDRGFLRSHEPDLQTACPAKDIAIAWAA